MCPRMRNDARLRLPAGRASQERAVGCSAPHWVVIVLSSMALRVAGVKGVSPLHAVRPAERLPGVLALHSPATGAAARSLSTRDFGRGLSFSSRSAAIGIERMAFGNRWQLQQLTSCPSAGSKAYALAHRAAPVAPPFETTIASFAFR